MSIVLYHHPYSRAAGVLWMLEEVGVDYALHPIDIMKGAQKAPELRRASGERAQGTAGSQGAQRAPELRPASGERAL